MIPASAGNDSAEIRHKKTPYRNKETLRLRRKTESVRAHNRSSGSAISSVPLLIPSDNGYETAFRLTAAITAEDFHLFPLCVQLFYVIVLN